jgi:hypothetical protein
VFAIADYGQDADYVICGIGASKRDEYLDGKHIHGRVLPQHVFADVKVLRNLNRHYHLFTTEQELMPFVSRYNVRVRVMPETLIT